MPTLSVNSGRHFKSTVPDLSVAPRALRPADHEVHGVHHPQLQGDVHRVTHHGDQPMPPQAHRVEGVTVASGSQVDDVSGLGRNGGSRWGEVAI